MGEEKGFPCFTFSFPPWRCEWVNGFPARTQSGCQDTWWSLPITSEQEGEWAGSSLVCTRKSTLVASGGSWGLSCHLFCSAVLYTSAKLFYTCTIFRLGAFHLCALHSVFKGFHLLQGWSKVFFFSRFVPLGVFHEISASVQLLLPLFRCKINNMMIHTVSKTAQPLNYCSRCDDKIDCSKWLSLH